jgi:hypothetical protein
MTTTTTTTTIITNVEDGHSGMNTHLEENTNTAV